MTGGGTALNAPIQRLLKFAAILATDWALNALKQNAMRRWLQQVSSRHGFDHRVWG
jgi:hypothetical protein